MGPVPPEAISFAGQAFAQAVIGYLGLKAVQNWLGRDFEQRLCDIYLQSCAGFFEDESIASLAPDEVMRLAKFFGSEKVAGRIGDVLRHGQLEAEVLRNDWETLGGSFEDLTSYLRVFMEYHHRVTMEDLPAELRMATALLSQKIASVASSVQTAQVAAEHSHVVAHVSTAEEQVSVSGPQVARLFEARLDDATKILKEKKLMQEARQALSQLEEEAKTIPDVAASSELMNKLYTNQAVCAERLGEVEVAKTYATKALREKPRDPRSLTNRAATGVHTGADPKRMLALVRRALKKDPDYRQAKVLEISIIADMEGVAAGLDLARQTNWADEDSAAQQVLSQLHLRLGDVQSAMDAAKRAADLDPTPERLGWAGLVLMGEAAPGDGGLYDIRIRGALEPDRRASEAIPYLQRAIDGFKGEQRAHLADSLAVTLCRALMAVGQYEEASQVLGDCVAHTQHPEVQRAAYTNLVEALLVTGQDAVGTVTQALERFPEDVPLKFVLGRALLSAGDEEGGLATLHSVLKEPDADKAIRRHAGLIIVGVLTRQHCAAEARSLLEEMETDASPFAILTWAAVLEDEGNAGKASCLVRALASENQENDGTLLVCAEYLRVRGLESDARPLYGRLVELFEAQATMLSDEQTRRWAEAAFYAGDWAKCIEIGSRPVRDRSCHLVLGLVKAAALEKLERFEEALDAYEALWHEFPGNRDVARGLTQVCYRLVRPAAAIPYLEHLVDTSEPDAHDVMDLAVFYALAGDVEASTRTARRALALAPDDRIVAANYIQLMLRNGRSELALEQMDPYLSRFPDDDFIQVWRGEPDELSQRFVQEIVEPQMKRHEEVAELYRSHPLPLGMMAKALGRSYVNLWNGIRRGELQQPFRSARGLAFAESELESATDAREIVLDESAGLTLQLLGLLSAVVEKFERVYIAQATVDNIREELLREESPDLRGLTSTLGLSTKFSVVSPTGNDSAFPLSGLADALGAPEFQSIVLAFQRGVPLFSDDVGIRDLTREAGCRGFGTRTFLELARRENLVDTHLYCRSIVRLIRENYHFISYNGEVLAWAIQSSGFEENDDTSALLAQFFKYDAEIGSYVRVFSSAICRLWKEAPRGYEGRRGFWTGRLLDLMAMRGSLPNMLSTLFLTVTCVALEAGQHLRTLMYEVFDIWATQRGVRDDWIALLIARTAIGLGDAVAAGKQDLTRARAFVESVSQHWLGRLQRLVRESRPDLYPLLFGD